LPQATRKIDIDANLARAAGDKAVRKALDQRLGRARKFIEAASKIAQDVAGLAATEELLLNEAHNVHDHRLNDELLNDLKRSK
jgi:hypothetical protein